MIMEALLLTQIKGGLDANNSLSKPVFGASIISLI